MFTNLRQTAQGFFAKGILFLLTGMFVLWGIGDVFRNMGSAPNYAATVGKTVISIPEFKYAERFSHGSPRQTLGLLISEALYTNEAKAMGIVVSDDDVVEFVHDSPTLHDKDGRFDKTLYLTAVENSGVSEQQFLEDLRKEITVKLLLGPLVDSIQVPSEMTQALYKTYEERRTASFLLIAADAVKAQVAAATDQEIKAYYDAHAKEFLAPEARTLTYVALPLAEVQSKIDVQEDELKHAFDEHKDEYNQPEQRLVDDLEFDNEQDTKQVAAKLAQGASWDSVAASAPIQNKGKTALGAVAMQQLAGDAGKQVFALKEGGVTSPVKVNFSWHLYRAGKVIPPRPDTYAEARPVIAKEIAARQAQDTLAKLASGFEDSLAGGATLEQAAEKIGQKAHTAGPITRDGETADGKKADLPAYDNFLNVAFSTAEKDHSQAVQATDGSYFLVRVDGVTPEHVRPFAEVKKLAALAATELKVKEKLEQVALDVSKQLREGKKSPAEVLAAHGLALKFVPVANLKRNSESVDGGELKDKALPHGLIGELFRIALQQTTHPYPMADGYALATVTQITPAPGKADPKVMQAIEDELKITITDEIREQYMATLRAKYPVSRNEAALGIKDEDPGE